MGNIPQQDSALVAEAHEKRLLTARGSMKTFCPSKVT